MKLTAAQIRILKETSLYRREFLREKKKKERQKREEQLEKEQQQRYEFNKFYASQMMANRGHDQQRGTAGHVMGDPSPGRSF